MTDYCQNRLTIEGSAEDIGAFAGDCLSVKNKLHFLDFEKILPTPPAVKGLFRSTASKIGAEFMNQLSSGCVGMEALTRKPLQPGQSFLDDPRVRRVGINTYDDLEHWLHQNDPASLELGRKCLAAFDACGCYFEDDWPYRWGCDPGRIQYSQANLGETSYHAVFASAWAAPHGIFLEIARRHPGLTCRLAALEEGNAYALRLTARNGVVNEETPAITDAFIDEMAGPEAVASRLDDERAFYEGPAAIIIQPLRHIRHWLSESKLKRALAGYPVCTKPHIGVEWMMSEQEARENFEFFLAQRAHRIDILTRFLAPFGVQLDFTEPAKQALDRWLATYGAFLCVTEVGSSFLTHNPEWVGPRAGLNVILDIAIFIGEFAITESPGLTWKMDVRDEPGRTRSEEGFQRPAIHAATPLSSFPRDVIDETHKICHSLCEASYMIQKGRFRYGSPALARQFVSKTLRHISLCACDDFETANIEWIRDNRAG